MEMINKLVKVEERLKEYKANPTLIDPNNWNSLLVDYYPPIVERLWIQWDETHRLYFHKIHPTTEPCLFHKHRWSAAFKMIDGCYEMGITRCENEVNSDEAYNLPVTASFILSAGSYYEMTDTHALHYVKPIKQASMSIMLTGNLYPEERKEADHPKLQPLTEYRKAELLNEFLSKIVSSK